MTILTYVQIECDTVLIDSRVYCREIIQVHHSDWMGNVVKKWQTLVESKFGTLRFQNGAVLSKNGVANNTEKYVSLTEAQCNAFLTFSRNTGNVPEKKLELIADFELAKQQLKDNLQRSFDAPVEIPAVTRKKTYKVTKSRLKTFITKLENRIQHLEEMNDSLHKELEQEEIMSNWAFSQLGLNGDCLTEMTDFNYSVADVISILNPLPNSSYADKLRYINHIIATDGIRNCDWAFTGLGVRVTMKFIIALAVCYRGCVGVDLERIPNRFIIQRDWLFRQSMGRINTRFPIG